MGAYGSCANSFDGTTLAPRSSCQNVNSVKLMQNEQDCNVIEIKHLEFSYKLNVQSMADQAERTLL